MTRKLAAATLVVLGLTAVVLAFLLGTTAGLRWSVDQALSRSGVPVEIGSVDGRLLGPASLSEVSYRDAGSSMRVRVNALEIDWRPGALLRGLLHITRLHASRVEITPGTSAGGSPDGEATLPEVSLPLAVRVDELRLDGLAMADESGAPATLVEQALLRGSVDADAVLLTDIAVDAGRFSIDRGRIRLALDAGMPLEASLHWRAAFPDLPVFSGDFTVAGSVGGTLTPVLDIEAPFAARGEGTVDNLLDSPRWTFRAAMDGAVALDSVIPSLPAVSLEGEIRADGDAASSRDARAVPGPRRCTDGADRGDRCITAGWSGARGCPGPAARTMWMSPAVSHWTARGRSSSRLTGSPFGDRPRRPGPAGPASSGPRAT